LIKFNRWVTIFVAHFLAKRSLEYQSARVFDASPENFKKPQIKILAVNSEEYIVPPWDRFKLVIREAFTNESEIFVDQIITTLEERVKNKVGLRPEAHNSSSLHRIRGIMEGNPRSPTLTLRMHCEAVLLALLEARQQAQDSADTKWEGLAKFYEVFVLRVSM
jgi:hypothetical protein